MAAPAPAARPKAVTPSVASWTTRLTGLDQPTNLSTVATMPNSLFVTQKAGTIHRLNVLPVGGVVDAGTYLDIRNKVEANGEGGLLSMVFSPRFATDGYLFITYSNLNHDLVVARLRAVNSAGKPTPSATRINVSTMRTIISINHRAHDNHWGGSLAFGPDNYLYVGTGDGGGAGDTTDSARKIKVLRGKILRLDVLHACNKRYYCVPKTNPLIKQGAPLVWLYGLRNPWKMNFNTATKQLWIGDVGQDAFEEVDVIPAKPNVRDLGWPCREGFHSFDPSRCAKHAYFAPKFDIPHPSAESVTGGVMIPSTYPGLAGAYLAGDYVTGLTWWYDPATKKLTSQSVVPQDSGGPVAFVVDQRSRVWLVTFSGSLMELRTPPPQ
jgi:glucose/arabinose dehydrogenase